MYAADLGTDSIYRLNVTENGDFIDSSSLISDKIAAGSGPRHLIFHPFMRKMYLINELSGMLTVFCFDNGRLKELQVIEADVSDARGSGDITITPDGRFLYTSHRLKNDGIAIFSVDMNGWVSKSGYQYTGIHPRNMMVTPNGKFLLVACKDSHRIEIYEINPHTGLLKNIHKDIYIHMPVCLKSIIV